MSYDCRAFTASVRASRSSAATIARPLPVAEGVQRTVLVITYETPSSVAICGMALVVPLYVCDERLPLTCAPGMSASAPRSSSARPSANQLSSGRPRFSGGSTAIQTGCVAAAPVLDFPKRFSAKPVASSNTIAPPASTGHRRRPATPAPDAAAYGAVECGVIPPLGVSSASSCGIISSALCQRSAGFFSRHFITNIASAGGMLVR